MASEPPFRFSVSVKQKGLGKPLGALCVYNVSAAESKGAAPEAPLFQAL